MTTATVVYRSQTGVTRRYAEEIAAHLRGRGLEVRLGSVGEIEPEAAAASDLLLLGCWTGGLLVVGQHPDTPWVSFVRALPPLDRPAVGLFATYKIATGSMFGRMRRALDGKGARVGLELRSRDGRLDEPARRRLDELVRGVPA